VPAYIFPYECRNEDIHDAAAGIHSNGNTSPFSSRRRQPHPLSATETNEVPCTSAGAFTPAISSKRRRPVDIQHQPVQCSARFDHPRPAHDEGSSQRFFIDPAFVEPAMLTQNRSPGPNNTPLTVFRESPFAIQVIQQLADIPVQ